jgi:hypothetical protein
MVALDPVPLEVVSSLPVLVGAAYPVIWRLDVPILRLPFG